MAKKNILILDHKMIEKIKTDAANKNLSIKTLNDEITKLNIKVHTFEKVK